MKIQDIAKLRLEIQQLTTTRFSTPQKLVSYMGAIQAQDYMMSMLAIGIRIPGATDAVIEAALDKGSILRTHVLRPTWHYVSSQDIYWMLELTAPRIRQALSSMDKVLELSDSVYKKTRKIFTKALEGGISLTRAELMAELEKVKIDTSKNRSSHLLADAEILGLLCSGVKKGNQRTYAFLPDRVKQKKMLGKAEALAELAQRYFASHGPATLKDFTWWSGLSAKDAKEGLESVKASFAAETVESETYFIPRDYASHATTTSSAHLIPGYDEFLISYKDRSASLEQVHNRKIVSVNGIFRPTLVINGQVMGLWKMTTGQNSVDITVDCFKPATKAMQTQVKKAAKIIGHFYNKPADLKIVSTF